MVRLINLHPLAIASVLISPFVFADETERYGTVGGWTIASDPSLGNGCFILAGYAEGSALRFGFNPNEDNLYMIIGDQKWKSIEYEKSYSIEVKFGDEAPWDASATGFSFDPPNDDSFLHFSIPLDEETGGLFLKEFMEESNVVVKYKGKEIANLTLKDSRRAAEQLLNCQTEYFETQQDPFAKESDDDQSDPFRKN